VPLAATKKCCERQCAHKGSMLRAQHAARCTWLHVNRLNMSPIATRWSRNVTCMAMGLSPALPVANNADCIDLGAVGLEVLSASRPQDKAEITSSVWKQLCAAGSLSRLPPLEHLSPQEQHELKSMPKTALPGLPTNSLRSLLHQDETDWKGTVCPPGKPLLAEIPDHPARPEKPCLVSGERPCLKF